MFSKLGSLKKYSLIILLILVSLFALSYLAKLFYADINVKKGRVLMEIGEYERALSYFDIAIDSNPRESFYYENRARCYAFLALISEKTEDIVALKKLSLNDLEYSYKLNPNNLRVIRNNIPTYYYLNIKDLSYSMGLDKDYEDITREYFSLIKMRYTGDVGTLVDIAKYEKKLSWINDYETTEFMIKRLRPDLVKWYPDLIN